MKRLALLMLLLAPVALAGCSVGVETDVDRPACPCCPDCPDCGPDCRPVPDCDLK